MENNTPDTYETFDLPSDQTTGTPDLAAPIEGDDLMTARYRADMRETRAAQQTAFTAQMEVEARLRTAQEAQSARAQALQEAEEKAQAAALRTLSEGSPAVRRLERTADGHAQRLRRELARADVVLAHLAAEVDAARVVTQRFGEQLAEAEYLLQVTLLTERQMHRREETQIVLATLARLVAEGRADNTAAVQLAQAAPPRMNRPGMTGFMSDRAARQTSSGQLYLPGEDAARTAGTYGGEMGAALAEQGFSVIFAPDVSLAEVPEDQGRSIAARRGVDLATLYQGWLV